MTTHILFQIVIRKKDIEDLTCFDVEHGMFIRSEIHFIVKSKAFNFPFIRSTFSVDF